MPLATVRVPIALESVFAHAEQLVSGYFAALGRDPARGTIEISGERYVLVRAASLSVEFYRLVQDLYGPGHEREAEEFAQNILYDLAHAIGRSDARRFHETMNLADPLSRLSAGPVHFAHAGWAFVDIFPESTLTPDEFFIVYEHPYSFEADAWLRAGQKTEFAACIMSAGYSSGWTEESFGVTLVATEVLCRARGDASCRFVMAHPARIEERARKHMTAHRIPDFFSRKRAEDQLRHAHDELEQRVEERTAQLTRAAEDLRREMREREQAEKQLAQAQRLEAVGRLAGGIAHDFNNVMAVILGNATLATRELPEGHAARAFVREIAAAGERAVALVRQLLAFSRNQPYTPEVLDMNELLRELGRMLERLIGPEVRFVLRLQPGAARIEADRAQVEQVAVNLVINARDAMPRGGTLTLETDSYDLDEAPAAELGVRPGRYSALVVTDTGVGMADHVAAHVFDPFFTTKDEGKGTGLGLSTVYGIAKQAGGAVALATQPGAGTRFTVLFPAVGARGNDDGSADTIVLAIADADRRARVAKALGDAGYALIEANDAPDALAKIDAHAAPVHLLLVEPELPSLSGPQLALRAMARRPSLRVVYLERDLDLGALLRGVRAALDE